VHLSIAEYSAGKYLATLNAPILKEFISENRNTAQWREVILLAAGAGVANVIIETLLSLEKIENPLSTELLLAASALTEGEKVDEKLTHGIADGLMKKICSNIPVVCYEAGVAALGLAELAPEIISPVVKELLNHPQEWTIRTAWTLLMQAGKRYVDVQLLASCFEKLLNTNVEDYRVE